MKNFLLKIDKFFDSHTTLWLFLSLLIVLRIPNFFDPYWYGDEAIYLTIGQSLRAGEQLYTEIVDHKTPIIYYLAAVPNQFFFRVLLMFWMIVSTTFFYFLSRKLFKNKFLTWLSLLIFVCLTTLPWFEGHIPNGELFVLGFVLVGIWLLSKSDYLNSLMIKRAQQPANKHNQFWIFGGGIFFGLAMLTKVPALTDLAAIMLVPWFVLTGKLLTQSKITLSQKLELFKNLIKNWTPLLGGVVLMIALSILYYVSRGSGADYLEFGLLYNFHYTQSWQLNLNNQLLNFLFTLPGKTLVLSAILIGLTLCKKLSIRLKFYLGWTALAVYAVLLSNRPYPHYFIQAILPLSLLVTAMVEDVSLFIKTKKKLEQTLTTILSGLGLIGLSTAILLLLNFNPYPTAKYYQNFIRFTTGELTQEEYYQTFNRLMADNYQLRDFLNQQGVKDLFIWGTNPMLYALTDTVPVGRFTVSFHIQDLNAYDETFEAVTQKQPKYIVVMNNAPSFPKLYNYLDEYYLPNYSYQHMTLHKRLVLDLE